jgi:hypothetical protein
MWVLELKVELMRRVSLRRPIALASSTTEPLLARYHSLSPPSAHTAMKKLRIVMLGGLAPPNREWLLNDGQIQNPSAQS